MTIRWTIEGFEPSDGSNYQFVTVDHQAWLRGSDDERTVHVKLNISARGVDGVEAGSLIKMMVKCLNE